MCLTWSATKAVPGRLAATRGHCVSGMYDFDLLGQGLRYDVWFALKVFFYIW